jgi:Protein of unknown function (DUF3105)
VVAAVLLVGVAFASSLSAKSYACTRVYRAPSGNVGPEGITMPLQGSQHVGAGSTIRYDSCPPTSGDHYNAKGLGPIRPGFYEPDAAVVPGGWVHNLEHGYIVVLYRGDQGSGPDAATFTAMRSFSGTAPTTDAAAGCGYTSKVVVARFDDMATPFAVLAWNRFLPLKAWDEAAVRSFAQQWMEVTAPEAKSC